MTLLIRSRKKNEEFLIKMSFIGLVQVRALLKQKADPDETGAGAEFKFFLFIIFIIIIVIISND